ncbi:hypothetical protein WJX74_007535 [Apatococcus lobatus]|uniref:Uncharacterized protein n=1 Tax=Apatococcus lobatus TaxID=904363 RepID=A0AAW1S7R2_9CHLO
MESNFSGTYTAKAMGKNGLVGDSSVAGQVTLKQQVKNTQCELKLTDASIRGRLFQGILVKATSKPRKDVKVTTTYDLNRSQFSVSPAYTLVRDGRSTTFTGAWQQAGNQLAVEVASSLSKSEKVKTIFTARNRSLFTEYSWSSGVWTVTPVVYLAPPRGPNGAWVYTAAVTAKQRLPERPMGLSCLTVGYDVGSESASLAVEGRPGWKAGVKLPLGRSKGIAHPTLAFTVSATSILDRPVRRAGSKPAAARADIPASPASVKEDVPEEQKTRAPTPSEQLLLKNVPLDEAFEKNMVKDERGIFTWSTNRK